MENIRNALDVKILGVSCGSGLDHLNCAFVRYRQASPGTALSLELCQDGSVPTSPIVRNQILTSLREVHRKPPAVTRLNALLGYMFSTGIKNFCQSHDIALASIDLVGTHTSGLGRFGPSEADDLETYSFGWNTNITAETGLSTFFDFTLFEGGIARPHISPVAFVNRLFLRHPTKFRACLDIGELANLSFIPPLADEDTRGTRCRDCGPGSLFIDYAMRYCTSNDQNEDHDGTFATLGKVNEAIVTQFLKKYNYLRTLPSLSMAREMFGDHEAQRLIDECLFQRMSGADTVATVTRITAENILRQYRKLLELCFPAGQVVEELFISGPSARNANIVGYLEAELPESVLTKPLADIGIPGEANEAVCYAHLALEAVLEQATRSAPAPSTPTPSRSDEDAVRGRFVRGRDWESLLVRLQRFSDGTPLQLTKDVRVAGGLETAIEGLGLR
ncbi:hypothetical protein EJ02DRAFT_393759 [Clathrospora elynae]|uniref:Uncharacterized protein n=1 Tax=Clathrospora elynae TaxID=706981 RepID=A0A6A5T3C3_9PLEO|nr:hypothetical protein EJ02DRAFT_393759 [Clathrospora elynae]